MERYRLKADGRIVAIGADGNERPAIAPPELRAPVPDARSIRTRIGLSQSQFAARIGVPVDTVRNWEQGKRSPRGPARALLKVIESAPDLAFAALKS
ncbi:MAG TPA: helix-turn-helix domain-containing protein [Bauldia sp.]|nr:helix-turn-helix domain-containing protein [Bauldia sp.]